MPRYIDADKLKDKAEKAHFYDEAGFDAPEQAVRVSDIDSIPTADVRENVHGRWIRHNRTQYLYLCIECSECGDIRIMGVKDKYKLPHYCEMCGARMDEGEE